MSKRSNQRILDNLKMLAANRQVSPQETQLDTHVLASLQQQVEQEAAINPPGNVVAAAAESPVAESSVEPTTELIADSTVEPSPETSSALVAAAETASANQSETALDELRAQSTQAIQALQASMQTQLNEESTRHQQELQRLREDLNRANQRNQSLESLFSLTGAANPITETEAVASSGSNINLNTSRPDLLDGAFAEFKQIYASADKLQKFGTRRGAFLSYDSREVRRFVRQNRDALIQSLEEWGKRNGLFQGPGNRVSKQAATTKVDLDGAFLTGLSAIMREKNRPGYIFWQFPTVKIEFEKGMGDTIAIARSDFLPKPASVDSRRLSGASTFVNIDPGSQRLAIGTVTALLEEWGLGADAANAPVGIPSFVQAYSMIDLMMVLEENLLEDYWCWEDMGIRALWMPTSRVVYNLGAEVTTDPALLVAGSDGTMTENYANNLFSYAQTQLIKPFSDGCYGIAVPTQVLQSFKNSLSVNNRWQAPNPEALAMLLNILNTDYIGEADRITGYAGKFCNLHWFATNAYGVGVPGTEGVLTETTGLGPRSFRKSFLFGRNSIARGIGTEMEILMESGSFDRIQRAIWLEESAFVALDVDPVGYGQTPGTPGAQQLRVLAVHTTDTPL